MAENQEENVEIIDEETITLYDDNNNPVDFNEVAVIEYEGEFYALMQPVEPMEGLGEDEAIIFKIIQKDDDTDEFVPVTDESVLDAVFNEYLKAEAECCDCDCDECGDCEDDDCDCGCEHHHHHHHEED
ncbi:MAG: DUF1292 domain-containing protein [Clostridiales bacterium]|nr:DUF1292 domain-containing protein [Clostridiales bacterium]